MTSIRKWLITVKTSTKNQSHVNPRKNYFGKKYVCFTWLGQLTSNDFCPIKTSWTLLFIKLLPAKNLKKIDCQSGKNKCNYFSFFNKEKHKMHQTNFRTDMLSFYPTWSQSYKTFRRLTQSS